MFGSTLKHIIPSMLFCSLTCTSAFSMSYKLQQELVVPEADLTCIIHECETVNRAGDSVRNETQTIQQQQDVQDPIVQPISAEDTTWSDSIEFEPGLLGADTNLSEHFNSLDTGGVTTKVVFFDNQSFDALSNQTIREILSGDNPLPTVPSFIPPNKTGLRRSDDRGGADFVSGRVDSAGNQYTHAGVDYSVIPGADVYASVSGTIVWTEGCVYCASDGDTTYKSMRIKTDRGVIVKLLYVKTNGEFEAGDRVEPNDVIGTAQDVSQKWNKPGKPKMEPHIHVEFVTPEGTKVSADGKFEATGDKPRVILRAPLDFTELQQNVEGLRNHLELRLQNATN